MRTDRAELTAPWGYALPSANPDAGSGIRVRPDVFESQRRETPSGHTKVMPEAPGRVGRPTTMLPRPTTTAPPAFSIAPQIAPSLFATPLRSSTMPLAPMQPPASVHPSVYPAVQALMVAASYGWLVAPTPTPTPAPTPTPMPTPASSRSVSNAPPAAEPSIAPVTSQVSQVLSSSSFPAALPGPSAGQRFYVIASTALMAMMATSLFFIAGVRAQVPAAHAAAGQPVAQALPIASVEPTPVVAPVVAPVAPVVAPVVAAAPPVRAPARGASRPAPPPVAPAPVAQAAPAQTAPAAAPTSATTPASPKKLDDAARSAEMLRQQLATAVNSN